MNTDENVKKLIDKVNSGDLAEFFKPLDGSNFGVYLPVYEDQGTVKLMLGGYSQIEKNLKVSISNGGDNALVGAKPVAWLGGANAKDSKCDHGGTASCGHCTGHADACRHCTHAKGKIAGDLTKPSLTDAKELDYDLAVAGLKNKKQLLESLSHEQFGLTLLHGHNDKFMFTELPADHVAVISNGITSFRPDSEVLKDPTFVPNVWRSINGQLKIAGGHSK